MSTTPAASESEKASLAIEYRQKQFCDSLVQKFLRLSEVTRPRGPGPASLKEATNLVERWILSLQEGRKTAADVRLPLFPPAEPVAAAAVAQRLAQDAYDKGFCRLKRSAANLAAGMAAEVERFRSGCREEAPGAAAELPTVPVSLCMADEDQGFLRIGDFQSPASRRLPHLVERFGLVPTARMLLRYESLGCGSYQWGDPLSVHRVYYRDFGARYEGFASPLNSRFLGLEGARFCSLFPDTDAPFGSLGSFFELDLAAHPGGWSVNPPFIESVLEAAAGRVTTCLDAGAASWFFLNYPDWRDSPGWRLLDRSPHRLARFDFTPGEFLIQDAYGRPSRPKMKLSIFVLGRLPPGCGPLERVRDAVFKARPPAAQGDAWAAATF